MAGPFGEEFDKGLNDFFSGVGNFFTQDIPNFFTKTIPEGWHAANQGATDFFRGIGKGFDDFGNGIADWWNNSAAPWLDENIVQNIGKIFDPTTIPDAIFGQNQGQLAYTDSGIPYDANNLDSQINALSQEYAYKRDDTAYQRLFADLKAAGVNPAVLLSNASATSSSAPAKSNYNISAKDELNSALKIGAIVMLLMKAMK